MANNPSQVPKTIDPTLYLPPKHITRGGLEPSWEIRPYRITSDFIQEYLTKKVGKFVPGAMVRIQPRYIENRFAMKKKKAVPQTCSVPTQSYASLLVALSANTIEKPATDPAYRWIVESTRDVRLVDSVYNLLIKKYRYNRDELKTILKDYSTLDRLKERFGMTEEYIQNLINLSNPVRQPTQHGDDGGWVIFAASAEKVIEDILTDVTIWEPKPELIDEDDDKAPKTTVIPGKGPAGSVEIIRVNRINQDLVEFVVYLHVGEFKVNEDPELRKLFDSFK